jgi:hypothetical protein
MTTKLVVLGLLLLAGALLAPASCDSTGTNSTNLNSADFSTAEGRANRFTRLVRGELPGRILDALFYEERIGGGSFPPGPSDYEFFAKISIQPEDASNWLAELAPISKPVDKPSIPSGVTWWMTPVEATQVTYHDPRKVFGRANGFVAVSNDRRTIYVWTFTF